MRIIFKRAVGWLADITLAPKCDISTFPGKKSVGMFLALETNLGSAVIIPETSVHISTTEALKAVEIIVV